MRGSGPVYGAQEKILGPVSVTPYFHMPFPYWEGTYNTAGVGRLRQSLLSRFGGLLSPPTLPSLIVIYLALSSTWGVRILMYLAPHITHKKLFTLLSQLGSEELGLCNFTSSAWKQGPVGKQWSAPGPTPGLS